jgi:Zn-dependent peptidase ImmA (M78 family)
MVVRVEVKPALLLWARERARLDHEHLLTKFPKLSEWEIGRSQPTIKQLEKYAEATHTSLGFLLLPRPPPEGVPIPDFRTMGDHAITRPSADLLDTVYSCQQRQEWYHDFARSNREDRIPFVGSLRLDTDVVSAASTIRDALDFDLDHRRALGTWTAALDYLRDKAESIGVLVMINGVVGSNTHRKLDPEEFRGFALADDLAPVVFVNGADTKAAQIFTLAHELAHVWLGESALSDADLGSRTEEPVERWCNQVAGELLVPLASLRDELGDEIDMTTNLERLARLFKVSTLVVLRRIFDAGHLSWTAYRSAYLAERDRVLGLAEAGGGSGGNFYNTTPVRVSKRFAQALILSTWEGQTLYRDATRLLGFKKLATLDELGHSLGIN